MKKKICPLMSAPDKDTNEDGLVECIEGRCMFWTEVFTTELIRTPGCIKVLEPQMVDGQLRV